MSERVLLEGEAAKEKWKKGGDVWNQWVDDNPEADVSFANLNFDDDIDCVASPRLNREVNFNHYRFPKGAVSFKNTKFGGGSVSFNKTNFGEGDVNFSGANFGEGDVDFSDSIFYKGSVHFNNTNFGEGGVNFSGANFGEGRVSFHTTHFGKGGVTFCRAIFGEGDVNFLNANFGEGSLDFIMATFGEGDVIFSGAKFSEGPVDFTRTIFGGGDVKFCNATFGDGKVDFTDAIFGDGKVDFARTKFGEGDVSFSCANFGEGDVSFSCAKFGEGDVSFNCANSVKGNVDFSNAVFESKAVNFTSFKVTGNATFTEILVSQNCEQFSFCKSTFDGPFSLSYKLDDDTSKDSLWQYAEVNFIPDLIGTKTSHHVNLHNLYCKPIFSKFFCFNRAKYIDDAARLGRLKELAESNKDHESALRFHADEMRVKRWIKTPKVASCLDFMFDKMSNYGQSILKPSIGLVCLFLLIFVVSFYGTCDSAMLYHLGSATNLSLSKTIPFVSGLVFEGREAAKDLGLSSGTKALINLLSVFSYICLFLIGLGLRNRFRI